MDGILELVSKDISIQKCSPTGEYTSPLFKYTPDKYGQANYLRTRCREEGIKVTFAYGSLELYSRMKVTKFLELVKESLNYDNILAPVLRTESAIYKDGRRVVCVITKHNDTIYSTEEGITDVVYSIYKKEIPRTQNYKIFRTLKEMKDHLTEEQNLVI